MNICIVSLTQSQMGILSRACQELWNMSADGKVDLTAQQEIELELLGRYFLTLYHAD